MSWSDLGWPDRSPEFPAPQPGTPPPLRPDAPDDIAAKVRRAEQRRVVVVPLCVLAGSALLCTGLFLYSGSRHGSSTAQTPAAAILLIAAALVVAFPLPALLVLLVIGPTWRQRQQHLALVRWQREHTAWLARERQRYLASLPEDHRQRFLQALGSSARADPPE
ncbi:MAG TPA: hypothetical protein VGS80_11065 [Ktedonobacterales bacterium]|nr:hypothetical protein [Ktedonobacterales bacterium]